MKYHLANSTKNNRNNINISNKIYYNSNKNIIKNFTNSAFENIIINVNSSNSLKKEKVNYASSSQNLNKSKLLMKNNNISSDILADILKGIISLKNNNLFDYIIKMLKLILYYYKGNNIISRNSYNYEINSDDNALNILYKNIFEKFSKETNIRQMLMNDFNNNKNVFKSIHFVFIFYLFSGIEYIKDMINEDGAKKININNYIDYNQLLNILLLFMNKEKCHLNENKNKNNKCIICSKLSKINEFNFNKNIYKTIEKSIDTNINIDLKSNDRSNFNINEKIIFDYNQKHIKNKYKMKKNMSNINSDISLKMLKSSYTNKSLKKNVNKSNQNIHTTNKSNDRRFMNYLKTTFDDKIKNNILHSHREYETGINNGNKIYSDWKNYISKENNNKSTNKNNKNENIVYNYSYKKNNIINLSYKNNIKDYNSLQNFFTRKSKEKKLASKKKKLSSNININNNHQIFFYPKVEQFLNNVYIINDNNKNTNDKISKEKEEKIKEHTFDKNKSKGGISKDKNNNIDILKKEDNTNDIFNYMDIINSQINSMENIFDNFKAQTMKIKQEMLEIENKSKLK